jgi:hypothetical protein
MEGKEFSIKEKLEFTSGDLPSDNIEGYINCEFIEYRDDIRNYCSEYEKYVKEYDPPCKAYVGQGSY